MPEPPTPGGGGTQIGDAVGKVLDEAGGRQVAGIVVFSDGQNNGGRSPARPPAPPPPPTPIFAVPVGSSKRIQDVAIVDLFATALVTVGDTARVAVTLESHGFDRRPVKVELREGDESPRRQGHRPPRRRAAAARADLQGEKAGPHYLTVHVPEQPEEPSYMRGNNTDTAFVRVSEEKLRVLFLEGRPSLGLPLPQERHAARQRHRRAATTRKPSTSSSRPSGGISRRPCASSAAEDRRSP